MAMITLTKVHTDRNKVAPVCRFCIRLAFRCHGAEDRCADLNGAQSEKRELKKQHGRQRNKQHILHHQVPAPNAVHREQLDAEVQNLRSDS